MMYVLGLICAFALGVLATLLWAVSVPEEELLKLPEKVGSTWGDWKHGR